MEAVLFTEKQAPLGMFVKGIRQSQRYDLTCGLWVTLKNGAQDGPVQQVPGATFLEMLTSEASNRAL